MKRNKMLKIVAIICVAALSFSLVACQSEEDRLASEAAAEESRLASEAAAEEERLALEAAAEAVRQAAIEQRIIEVLEWTPAVKGFSLTYADAINGTFHDYEWSFRDYNEWGTIFIVTFTGNYSPYPADLPYMSQKGTISWLVDIENNTVSVFKDPDDISSAFFTLAAYG